MASKFRSLITPMAIVVAVAAVVVPVSAESKIMTDRHIDKIEKNCPVALVTLGRIHANDAPQYINSNQIFFSIGDKLMARLNSRLTLNQHDASNLVKTSSEFNKALQDFRNAYKNYDDTMAELVRMDCQKTPVTFYDRVATVREQRSKVHDAIMKLEELIKKYRDQVKQFSEENLGESEQ